MLKALSIKARRLSGSSQFVIAFLPRHVRLAVLDKLKTGAVPKRNGEEVDIVARLDFFPV
jgi:hypothetical protein